MRFSNLCIYALSIVILSGCATKSSVAKFEEAKRSQPHYVSLNFNNTFCRTYFIQNDAIKYEFSESGRYQITPGNYLVIEQCSNGNHKIPLAMYTPGDESEFSFAPGTKVLPHNLGKISGPLK